MNQSSWTHLGSSFTLTILLLTLFVLAIKASSSIDPQFLACTNAPKTCENDQIVIEYPFHIKGQSEPYCGYPGFEVSCNGNRQPVLVLGDDDYVIHQIDNQTQTLRVSNLAFSDSNTLCGSPIHNLTLQDKTFELGPSTANATVLFNCNSSYLLSPYRIESCDDSEKGLVLAMAGNDSKWVDGASKNCGGQVVAPVALGGGEEVEETAMMRLGNGFVLKWTASNCSVCAASGGKCGFDSASYHFQCFCPDRPHPKHCVPVVAGKRRWGLKQTTGLAISVVVLLIISTFLVLRKCAPTISLMFWKRKTDNFKNIEVFLEDIGSLCPKRFSYSDIKKITNSFKDKVGEGGFGGVYRGKLQDGCLVAVKVLKGSKGDGEDFINEVSSISRTSHVNVVTLLGFCFEGHKRALVYEFMPNGSLEKFIYEKSPLTSDRQLKWETLYKIAVGIARGLEYLHRGCNTRILHFDIKPHNILLDEDFCPKICDFGLAKICPQKESIVSMLGARGTPGYIAPEVFSRNFGGVSHKSDVYSYGMMVLEMVGGRRNIDCEADRTSELYFPHWIYKRIELHQELGLHGIADDEEKEEARKMIIVSMWCIQTDPSNRPPMSRVVEMLEGRIDSLQIPPKPFLSSPSRSPGSDSPVIVSSYSSIT